MSPYIADEADLVKMAKDLAWCAHPKNADERDIWLEYAGWTPAQIKRLGEKAAAYAEQERKLRSARAL